MIKQSVGKDSRNLLFHIKRWSQIAVSRRRSNIEITYMEVTLILVQR